MASIDEDGPTDIVIRGARIREDENGHWNLNDIWTLAHSPASKAPKFWKRNKAIIRLIDELQKKVTSTHLLKGGEIVPVIYAERGRGNAGTFAHPILAASYAGYLSEKLEIEIREVWLRYRAGDAALADEILQRASPEDNERVAIRALGRVQRNNLTATLKEHGVIGSGYPQCTDAVYEELFDGKARKLRVERGLPVGANVRDTMLVDELVSVMFAEMLAKRRIDDENPTGNRECEDATRRSSKRVRATIEEDRRDRQKKLVG